MTPFLENTFH